MKGVIEFVLNESRWLFVAMVISTAAVAVVSIRRRQYGLGGRRFIVGAMTLFYGCLIGVMGTGHLLAVTIKLVQGTLEPSPWLLYLLGLVLAVPSWWMVWGAMRAPRRTIVPLNVWVGTALLVLGLQNAPLAAPAFLNVGYQYHSRRAVGWAIVAATVALYAALLVGSLVFLASGQSFEQFRGME